VGVCRDCPFWIPPVISGTGKAQNFKFCTHIHIVARNKNPLKISGKVTVGVLRDSRKFSGHAPIYRAHRAVIFAIAQLSCFFLSSPTAKMAKPILTHDGSCDAVSAKEVTFGGLDDEHVEK